MYSDGTLVCPAMSVLQQGVQGARCWMKFMRVDFTPCNLVMVVHGEGLVINCFFKLASS